MDEAARPEPEIGLRVIDDRSYTEPDRAILLAESGTVAHSAAAVLRDVLAERARQDAKWEQQNHDDGTGPNSMPLFAGSSFLADTMPAFHLASIFQTRCERRFESDPALREGEPAGTWTDIYLEEVFEALAEDDPAKLRAELVQTVAVGIAWIESIDRRTAALAEAAES